MVLSGPVLLAFFGTAVGVSVAIGPILGGLLIQLGGPELGWRLTFLINVPFGVLTLILGWRWFPRPLLQAPSSNGVSGISSLDPVGAVILGLAVLALLFPFVESPASELVWLLLPLALLLLFIWIKWERWYARRGYSPMVDLDIFRIPSYRNGSIIMTLYFFGMTSIWVLIPLFLQQNAGFSAFEAGVIGIPSALLSAVSANWAGHQVSKHGRLVVIGGLGMVIFSILFSMAIILLHQYYDVSIWWLLLSLSFFGLGQGSTISPNQALTLAEVPLNYAGSSGAVMQTGQRIGTSVGIALITALVFALHPKFGWSAAVVSGMFGIVLIVLLALLMAFKDLSDRKQR